MLYPDLYRMVSLDTILADHLDGLGVAQFHLRAASSQVLSSDLLSYYVSDPAASKSARFRPQWPLDV